MKTFLKTFFKYITVTTGSAIAVLAGFLIAKTATSDTISLQESPFALEKAYADIPAGDSSSGGAGCGCCGAGAST